MIKVNGNTIFHIKDYIYRTYGQEMLDKIIADTDPDVQAVLHSVVGSGEYYDLKVKDEFIVSVEKNLSYQEFEKCTEAVAKEQMKGFFGFFLKLVTLDVLLSRTDMMWKRNWSHGTLKLVEKKKGMYKLKLSGIRLSRAMRLHVEHYIRTLFETVGKKKYKSFSGELDGINTDFIYMEITP